jgi:hypothetical protein
MDRLTVGQIYRWKNGQRDKCTDGEMEKEKWPDGEMDKWTDKQLD